MLEKSETGKKRKKKQSEIKLFTSTIQMSLDSPLTWTLIAVHKKGGGAGRHPRTPPADLLMFFYGLNVKLISSINNNMKKRPA